MRTLRSIRPASSNLAHPLPYLAGLLLALAPFDALRAEEAGDSTLVLGDVAVSSNESGPLSARDLASSVDVIGGDLLEQQPVQYSWELFNRAPGVMLTQFNQGTTSGKLSFRGFNGEGEVNAVKLLIDGIPSNTNDGNMPFIDMVFPLDIDSIEVVRGTNDPRYGLHNIAGNASINTRIGGNDGKLRVRYGSFGTRELQLVKGFESGRWSQNYFFAGQAQNGYRGHADAERYSFAGKWFYTGDAWRAGLILRHYSADADEAGYLDQRGAHADPRQSYASNASDTGRREMNQASVHFDFDLSDSLSLALKNYVNTFDDQRWTRYWHTTSQQERDSYETQYGSIATLTWRPTRSFTLEGGADFQHQDNLSQRYKTVARVRSAQIRDQQFDLDVYGGYLQAVISPVASLKIIPALRIDRLQGSYSNRLTGETAQVNDYGYIRQPKIGIVYTPIEEISLYGNWGRTFQVGVGSGAYRLSTQSEDLKPSLNDGWETGIKFRPAHWLDGRLAYWEQKASDEVQRKLNDALGDTENVGKTLRRGYDLQLNLHASDNSDVWLSYSRQFSKILTPNPNLPASQGKEIDHVPHHLYSLGASYRPLPVLELSAWLNGQSAYYLERTNSTGSYGAYTLLNLGANYRVMRNLSVDLQVKNVANRYYEYVWYDSTAGVAQSLHAPGDGRALYAGLTYDF